MIYYINKENQLYIGDLQNGDREANNEELLNHFKQLKLQDLKTERDKYKIANNYNNEYAISNILNGLYNYTEQERFDCKIFFNDLIHKYDNYKLQINNCTTKQELDLITITFEE